jgi:HlyD family secretion protein
MKKRIIPVIILVAALAAAGYYATMKNKNGQENLYSGTVEATEVKISAEIGGRVLEVNADEGDRVKSGAVLVRIDHESLDAQLAQAEAARMTARGQSRALGANMDEARINLGRSEGLLDAGSISTQKFDSVKYQKEALNGQKLSVQGQIKQAEATADYFRTQIRKTTIAAPISGTVLKRAVEPGEMTMPGASLLTLADLENCRVRIYIPETKLGLVKIGQKVKVYSDSFPGKTYEGTVVTVSDQAEFTPKNVQTKEERVRLVYGVKVDVKNPAGELKIGMPVDAELAE